MDPWKRRSPQKTRIYLACFVQGDFWMILINLPRDLSPLDYHLPYRNSIVNMFDTIAKHQKVVQEFHPGRLTWNLQITHLERKMIFQTSMIMFHVNLPGCWDQWISLPVSPGELPNNPDGQQPSSSTSRATDNEGWRWKLCCLKHGTFPETNSKSC